MVKDEIVTSLEETLDGEQHWDIIKLCGRLLTRSSDKIISKICFSFDQSSKFCEALYDALMLIVKQKPEYLKPVFF